MPVLEPFCVERGGKHNYYLKTKPEKIQKYLSIESPKTLKEIFSFIGKYSMPCFMVIDGIKTPMDDDLFDRLASEVSDEQQEPITPIHTRWNEDGTYNSKPLDPQYFKKYFQKHLKQPFQCPDCKRMISSKSNLSKHRSTKICRNSRGEM